MADVKTLTVHGIPYSIKDETARNSYSTLSEKVNTNEGALNALETRVQSNTTGISNLTEQVNSDIEEVNGEITQVKSNVNTLQSSVSSANDTILKLGSNKANASITINGDFMVNQRGVSSYTGTSSGAYTVDMWKLTNGTLTKPSAGVGVTVTAGSNACTLVQKIPNKYAQSRHTLHTKCAYKEYSTQVQGNNTSTVQIDDSVGSISLTVDTDYITVTYTINPNKTAYIEYCDVFMSSTYSAHTIEDFGVAYYKCLRFFYRLGGSNATTISAGYVRNDHTIRSVIQYPVIMEKIPAITLKGEINIETETLAYSTILPSPYSVSQVSAKSFTLTAESKEQQTAGLSVTLYFSESNLSSYYDISCEP